MQFFDVIERRQSVRAYQAVTVEPDKLDAVLGAARMAPSAGGLQAYAIVVVESPETKARLSDAALGQGFLAEAAAVLVFFADRRRSELKYGERGATQYCIQDATIAAAYAQLAATAQGLGCCWVGAFDVARVSQLLDAPPHWRPVAMLTIGCAADAPAAHYRRPLDELVRRERCPA